LNEPRHPYAPAPVPLRCPRCGSTVGPEQDWCLECGAPARTRLAPTPNWRLPVLALAAIVVVAGLALAIAFTTLTKDDGTVTAATASTASPAVVDTSTAGAVTPPPQASTIAPGMASTAAPASSVTPSGATPAG